MSITLPDGVVVSELVPFRCQESCHQSRRDADGYEHEHHRRGIMFTVSSLPGKQKLVNRLTGACRAHLKAVRVIRQQMLQHRRSLLARRGGSARHTMG